MKTNTSTTFITVLTKNQTTDLSLNDVSMFIENEYQTYKLIGTFMISYRSKGNINLDILELLKSKLSLLEWVALVSLANTLRTNDNIVSNIGNNQPMRRCEVIKHLSISDAAFKRLISKLKALNIIAFDKTNFIKEKGSRKQQNYEYMMINPFVMKGRGKLYNNSLTKHFKPLD